ARRLPPSRRRGDVPLFFAAGFRRRVRRPPRPQHEPHGMSRQLELKIDRIKCDGRGLCAELLPELIRLDDWGYPIIASGPVPEHLISHAQKAVAACPVLALALRQAERKAPS